MLTLKLAPVDPKTRGIYRVGGELRMPKRALFLEPAAAESFARLERDTGGLVYSDLLRSAEASLAAMQAKNGVQPPAYSAHNYGLAFDVAVDNYIVPGTSEHAMGTLALQSWAYQDLLGTLALYGWYCHRRDGKTGSESWHFNYLGTTPQPYLDKAKVSWAAAVEAKIQELYGSAFVLDAAAQQTALKKLRLYSGEVDGALGPLSREAIKAFQRTWKLPSTGEADQRAQRVLAFVAADVVPV